MTAKVMAGVLANTSSTGGRQACQTELQRPAKALKLAKPRCVQLWLTATLWL